MTDSLHDSINDWLAWLSGQGKSRGTISSYRNGVAHFCRWSEQSYGQPFDPQAIIPRDIAEWKSFQQVVEGAAPSTVNSRLTALSRYFKWAVNRDICRRDPTTGTKQVRLNRRRPRGLADTELRLLRRRIDKEGNLRDIALFELMVGTGLRVSEVLALEVRDITLSERKGEVAVRSGKGGQPRTVPLTAPVRKALQTYLADNPTLQADDSLWVGERGGLRDRSGVFYLLRKYARLAGLDEREISPHTLRHTFATRYLRTHVGDLRGLAAILGHSSLDTVMIYTEPTADEMAARMEIAELDVGRRDDVRSGG
jgi:integrase/recombinase XerD